MLLLMSESRWAPLCCRFVEEDGVKIVEPWVLAVTIRLNSDVPCTRQSQSGKEIVIHDIPRVGGSQIE